MKPAPRLVRSPRPHSAQTRDCSGNEKSCVLSHCFCVHCVTWAHVGCGQRGLATVDCRRLFLPAREAGPGRSAHRGLAVTPSALSVFTAIRGPSCWR